MKLKYLLFLSTGDTCRAPMAAAYLRKLLADKGIRNISVRSAGVMTVDHILTPLDIINIVSIDSIDLRTHQSRKLKSLMLDKADLILGLSDYHIQVARKLSPMARGKVFLLKEYVNSGRGQQGICHKPERRKDGSIRKLALKRYGKDGLMNIRDPMGCSPTEILKVWGEIKGACEKLMSAKFISGKVKLAKSR